VALWPTRTFRRAGIPEDPDIVIHPCDIGAEVGEDHSGARRRDEAGQSTTFKPEKMFSFAIDGS